MLNIREAMQLKILEFVHEKGAVRSEDIEIDYSGPDPRAVYLIASKNKKILKTDGYLGRAGDDLWTVTESGEAYMENLYDKLGDKKRKEKFAKKIVVTGEDHDDDDMIGDEEEATISDEKKVYDALFDEDAYDDEGSGKKKKSPIFLILIILLLLGGGAVVAMALMSNRESEPTSAEAPFAQAPAEGATESNNQESNFTWGEDEGQESGFTWGDDNQEGSFSWDDDTWWEEEYRPQGTLEDLEEINMFFFGQRMPAIYGIDFRVNFNPFIQRLEVDIHNWGTYFTGFESHILLSDPFGNINYSFLVNPSLLPSINESRYFVAELERPLTAVAFASVITDFQPDILDEFRTLTNITTHRHFDTDYLQFMPTSRGVRISEELDHLINTFGSRSQEVQNYLLQARIRRQQIGGRVGEWMPYQVDITPATIQFIAGLQTPGDILLHLNGVVFNQNDIDYIRATLATFYSLDLRHRVEEALIVLEDVANVEVSLHANPLFNPSVTQQNLTQYHHNRVERLRHIQSIGLIERITQQYLGWMSEAIILSFLDEDICYEDFVWWNRRFNQEFMQPIMDDQALFLVHGVPRITYDIDILMQIHSFFYGRPEPRFRAIHDSLGIVVRVLMGVQPLPGVTGFIPVNFTQQGTGEDFIEIFPSVYLQRVRMGSRQPEQLYFDVHSFSTSDRVMDIQFFFYDADFNPITFISTFADTTATNPRSVDTGLNLHNVSFIRIRRVF